MDGCRSALDQEDPLISKRSERAVLRDSALQNQGERYGTQTNNQDAYGTMTVGMHAAYHGSQHSAADAFVPRWFCIYADTAYDHKVAACEPLGWE